MQRVWRPEGFAAAVAALLFLFVAVAAADAASDDEEFASPHAAARPLQPIARTAGNASLAPMSDWEFTPERHSGAWLGFNPQQLSAPLLTGHLGCLKCVLDGMLGDDQLTRIFERTTFINRVTGRYKDPDVPLDKRFQEEIVKGMHARYDRIIDKDTKRNLLNWAVTTYHEGRVNLLRFVTTGTMNYDLAAAAACDVDGNLPDDPCLKGGSLHTTWTAYQLGFHTLLVHVYLWWWPADYVLSHPLNRHQFKDLVVQLVLRQNDAGTAAELAGPAASNDEGLDELFELLGHRARSADTFSVVVASCTASAPWAPFEAPLNLTAIQVCVREGTTEALGAPRGILVVSAVESVEYTPSGHMDLYKSIRTFVRAENPHTFHEGLFSSCLLPSSGCQAVRH